MVTGHDIAEAVRYQREPGSRSLADRLELLAAGAYLLGTILFTVGSIFFLSSIQWFVAGAWCFVIGSLLFVVGACINVLQIVQAETLLTLQLMNLTAINFVVGAVLFTVASIPYLWGIESAEDRVTIYDFLAWQYLVGSILFLAGGIFSYWRAYVVIQKAIEARAGGGAA